MQNKTNEIYIVGAGMVGLCLAHQLRSKYPKKKIVLLEKEQDIGMHSSGRNSGVIHAGIYYEPDSIKAKVCINGGKRLKKFCRDEDIEINECGKVIVAQDPQLDSQLDFLFERGKKNGAKIEIISQNKFRSLVPFGDSSTKRAIWSPATSVINPKQVINKLKDKLISMGVEIIFNCQIEFVNLKTNIITFSINNESRHANFSFLFNCAGLYADKVAKLFGISENLLIFPFKGIYWNLDPDSHLEFNTNLYPVPDLNVPFLGVHVTPSYDGNISLGPTAIPSLGRENYKGFENIETLNSFKFLFNLAKQFVKNENGFRKYSLEQALHGIKPLFYMSAKKLIPDLKIKDLIPSNKIGIRPQLYDIKKERLIKDFVIKNSSNSTHILNAISPAFTASFEFADLIINQSTIID